MITLKDITKENFWECIGLEVTDGQKEYVTSNAVSLAQSKYQSECIPLAVYSDDEIAGFVMYCIDEDDGEYWIYRMMVDKRFQGCGIGKAALELVTLRIKADRPHGSIYLGVHRESESAVALYTHFGFKFTGKVYGAEHIMKYEY